jgi:PAS domain S-box-containing protein
MIPEIIWTALPDGYEDFHNSTFTEYTGLNSEELKGFGWQKTVHPDDLKIVHKVWDECLKKGMNYEIEYRIRNKEGVYKWFLIRATPWKDEQGNVIKWFGTTTDIDFGKSLRVSLLQKTDELKHANHELMKVNDIMNHFVYIAAHDLRSPVNNMKMLFEILKDEVDPKKREELFLFMEKSILRLDRTVNGLVEVIQSANEESAIQQLKFDEIVPIVIADLSISYPDISTYIRTDFKSCPTIRYIKPFLISIIKNLVSNSYKYQSHQRKLQINISTAKVDDLIKLEVKDNGIGYDMNKVKDIFAPFKRFTGQGEGTGVGLYVLKNLVEKNGGKVEAQGQEDAGAVFTIYLKEYN